MDLGILVVNTSNELGIFGILAFRILRPTDEYQWLTPYHVLGKATAVGMSAAESDHNFSYKTDFGIWRGNQEF